MTIHIFGEISDDIQIKYHLPLGSELYMVNLMAFLIKNNFISSRFREVGNFDTTYIW